MANLIPPGAKKAITTEYWIRVVTLWFVLMSFAFIVIGLLKLPTFVLVQSQLNSFSGEYADAQEKEEAFKSAEITITEANDLAVLLADFSTSTQPSEIIKILDDIAGREVSITEFSFTHNANSVESIRVTGVANTRVALANFSDEIENHPMFMEAELPISNLAKDRDITFNIAITPAAVE